MIRRPPRSTQSRSSAASDVYKRQGYHEAFDRLLSLVEQDRSGLLELFLVDLTARKTSTQNLHRVGLDRTVRTPDHQPDHRQKGDDPDSHPDPATDSPGHHQNRLRYRAGRSPAHPQTIGGKSQVHGDRLTTPSRFGQANWSRSALAGGVRVRLEAAGSGAGAEGGVDRGLDPGALRDAAESGSGVVDAAARRVIAPRVSEAGHHIDPVNPDRGRAGKAKTPCDRRIARVDVADGRTNATFPEHVFEHSPGRDMVRAVLEPQELDVDHGHS